MAQRQPWARRSHLTRAETILPAEPSTLGDATLVKSGGEWGVGRVFFSQRYQALHLQVDSTQRESLN